MPVRKALTVTGALGDELVANQVLHRFGFDAADVVPTATEALQRIRQQPYELLVLAVDQMDATQMALLERELRREPRTNVLVTAPKAESDLLITALRAGVHEFLVRPVSAQDLNVALDRITRRVPGGAKRGSVVTVYSAKGGVGVTTVAVNLAFQLAAAHADLRVALADLVVGMGDVRTLLNLKSSYDINDLVARQERVDADVLFSLLSQRGRVWILPSSDKSDTLDIDAAAATAILSQLRSNFGMTVVDCEDHLSDHTIAALDSADRIVLVTQLTIPVLRSTQRTLQLFARLGYRDDKTMVVVNRFHSADTISIAEAATVLERPIVATLANDFSACSKALIKGAALSEAASHSALVGDFNQLAGKVLASLGEEQKPVTAPAEPVRGLRATASRR